MIEQRECSSYFVLRSRSGLASIYIRREMWCTANQNIFIQSNIMTIDFARSAAFTYRKLRYFYSEKYLTTVRKALVELNKIDIWLDKTSNIITVKG